MADRFVAVVEGLASMDEVAGLQEDIETAAYRAVNAAAVWGRKQAELEIHRNVNLPPGYLKPSTGRLTVTQLAQKKRLEAIITARGRPTSLARFVVGNPGINRPGVRVRVRNKTTELKQAFLIRLRSGDQLTETQFNVGLAVRLKPGERLDNKRDFVQMRNGLYLLYGPSVDQIFRANDESGVADELSPDIAAKMETEFRRQMGLR